MLPRLALVFATVLRWTGFLDLMWTTLSKDLIAGTAGSRNGRHCRGSTLGTVSRLQQRDKNRHDRKIPDIKKRHKTVALHM
jgi:hypothetical protein